MLISVDNTIINTDHIATVSAAGPNFSKSVVRFRDGTSQTFASPLWPFEQACGVFVPAAPGFLLVRAILPDASESGVVYTEEPVIAFRLVEGDGYSDPMPITVSGEPTTLGGVRWVIKQPNGVCFGPDGQHNNIEAFKTDCERASSRLGA